MRRIIVYSLILWWGLLARATAEDTWPQVLAAMPLLHPVAELNRTNCVRTVLESFNSNAIVKAIVFLPGATDEFYFFRRATAHLAGSTPTLLDAVQALTNQTLIRATFKPPLLLLHVAEEPTESKITVNDAVREAKIRGKLFQPHTYFDDRDWDHVEPLLHERLWVDLRPWRYSQSSWHFYRHSFAGWNLNCWEALQASSLAGGTQVVVNRNQVLFQGPPRAKAADPATK